MGIQCAFHAKDAGKPKLGCMGSVTAANQSVQSPPPFLIQTWYAVVDSIGVPCWRVGSPGLVRSEKIVISGLDQPRRAIQKTRPTHFRVPGQLATFASSEVSFASSLLAGVTSKIFAPRCDHLGSSGVQPWSPRSTLGTRLRRLKTAGAMSTRAASHRRNAGRFKTAAMVGGRGCLARDGRRHVRAVGCGRSSATLSGPRAASAKPATPCASIPIPCPRN